MTFAALSARVALLTPQVEWKTEPIGKSGLEVTLPSPLVLRKKESPEDADIYEGQVVVPNSVLLHSVR